MRPGDAKSARRVEQPNPLPSPSASPPFELSEWIQGQFAETSYWGHHMPMSRDDLWTKAIATAERGYTPPDHELALIQMNAKRSGASIRGQTNRIRRVVEILKDAERLGLELVRKVPRETIP